MRRNSAKTGFNLKADLRSRAGAMRNAVRSDRQVAELLLFQRKSLSPASDKFHCAVLHLRSMRFSRTVAEELSVLSVVALASCP
jgi:hypothetical protein